MGSATAALADAAASPALLPSCEKEHGRPSDREPPPGQLSRRGVVGDVVRIIEEDGTLIAIVVGTQFGTVEIGIPEDLDTDAGVGDRVAVLTVKEPKPLVDGEPPEGGETDTPFTVVPLEEGQTGTPFRTTVAKKITIIPGTATGSHHRGVVLSQGDGTTEIIDDEGNVDEFETTDSGGVQVPPEEGEGEGSGEGTSGGEGEGEGEGDEESPEVEDETISSGTDAIILLQCGAAGSDPLIRSIQQAARIAERLERIQTKFADDPDKLAKFEDLQEKQEERIQARLDRTANNAPPGSQGSIGKAQRNARGECEEDPDPELCPDYTRKRKGKGKSSGSNGGDDGDGGDIGRGQGAAVVPQAVAVHRTVTRVRGRRRTKTRIHRRTKARSSPSHRTNREGLPTEPLSIYLRLLAPTCFNQWPHSDTSHSRSYMAWPYG